ncbi:hypothetical protein [Aliarcobacter skirrowii]|uniref:hypothetical protein n=1 Tax=Aliarcobacter skirrowii TaxID=28200 RepID=UPI000830B850|nr:hypothetical protein [Aliarcobacter skirrowii]
MIKNLILISLTSFMFTGCVSYYTNKIYAGEQEDIKLEYLALDNTQKQQYLKFIKEECLLKAEINELTDKQRANKRYMNNFYYQGSNNYLTLEHLEGIRGYYWNYGHWKVSRQGDARAVRFCHNQFFKEHNIEHTKTTEKAN